MHAKSFMFIIAIEAKERRDFARSDAKGAFLLANQEDFTTFKFVNDQVDAMCEIDKKYKKHITCEGKQKLLCFMLSKALHGTATVALLWFKLLTQIPN